MGIILTGDMGEVIRGTSMIQVVRDIDGFMKESISKEYSSTGNR
jgi:hypothetical protein